MELECNHCGDAAIESPDNMFTDGDGEACMSCGFPGHVSVDSEVGYDDEATADWVCRDGNDDTCRRPDCEECNEVRAAFGLRTSEVKPR